MVTDNLDESAEAPFEVQQAYLVHLQISKMAVTVHTSEDFITQDILLTPATGLSPGEDEESEEFGDGEIGEEYQQSQDHLSEIHPIAERGMMSDENQHQPGSSFVNMPLQEKVKSDIENEGHSKKQILCLISGFVIDLLRKLDVPES